jgi:hypothetical protein
MAADRVELFFFAGSKFAARRLVEEHGIQDTSECQIGERVRFQGLTFSSETDAAMFKMIAPFEVWGRVEAQARIDAVIDYIAGRGR